MNEDSIEVGGRDVRFSNPDKVFFPELGVTKRGVLEYYLAVATGALTGCLARPMMLRRHPNGVGEDSFYQKRVPVQRPDWIETITVSFPSGRTAEFLTVMDVAHLAWMVNLGCIELNPWPVRRTDVDHPDELRIDLDPTPGISFGDVREVAQLAGVVLGEHGLVGFPKTSGKRGIHINVRIEPIWEFTEVRRAALALAREIERRAEGLATTAWWKEERVGVFVDYNQNARDRTIASAYSVRAVTDGLVSCPLSWEEVEKADPGDFDILNVPARLASSPDPASSIDAHPGKLTSLLELATRDEKGGLGEAPWPPHFPKAKGEPRRVAPSRRAKRERDA